MAFPGKRNQVCSVKVTDEEKAQLVTMATTLHLPLQELLRRGAFKEGRRLLSIQRQRQKKEHHSTGS